MRTIEDALVYTFKNENITDKLSCIDLPNYYNFEQMLVTFHELYNSTRPEELHEKDMVIICITHDAFRSAKKKGFDAIYLYDYLDFTDDYYYIVNLFPQSPVYVLESADTITADLIYRIVDHIPPMGRLYLFHDSYILRKYNSEEDARFINSYKNYNIEVLANSKSFHSNGIQSFLNKLRSKKNLIEYILSPENMYGNRIELVETSEFMLSDIDVSKVIITPHRTLVRTLNPAIRRYLGILDYDDEYKPMPNEWIISHGPSTCFVDGREVTLPIGYRLKVKDVIDPMTEPHNVYTIIFDYTFPTGDIKEAKVNISRSYIQYLMDYRTDLPHAPNSYNYYFGYVVEDFYFISNRVNDAQIIYDHTLLNERRDLYSCVLPIKVNIKIFYSLRNHIKFKE